MGMFSALVKVTVRVLAFVAGSMVQLPKTTFDWPFTQIRAKYVHIHQTPTVCMALSCDSCELTH